MLKRISFCFVICLAFLLSSCVSQPEVKNNQASNTQTVQANTEEQNIAKGLIRGESSTSTTATGSNQVASSSNVQSTSTQNTTKVASGTLSEEDQIALNDYIARMKFMVYFDEKTGLDPQIAKLAIAKANKYLNTELEASIVDFEEIEKKKTDLRAVYQKETGGSIDFIQYLAQNVNADIYIEVSFTGTSQTRDSSFWASANGSIKVYDTSTSELYATETFQMGQQTKSLTSERDALTNAVVTSVYMTMPRIKTQLDSIKKKMSRGIAYQLVLQKTQDQDAVDEFEYALNKKLGKVEMVSYSANETKFNIYTFKSPSEIKRAITDAKEDAGLTSMYRVSQFYKVYIYNTGM